jgi:hypothetical protein
MFASGNPETLAEILDTVLWEQELGQSGNR